MNILIESTNKFEQDLENLTENDKLFVINKINHYTQLFIEHKNAFYQKLIHLPLPYISEDESSLYILRISTHLMLIMTIDEDPIFEQTIFTLFRVVKHENIGKAFSSIAESIYQDLKDKNQELLEVS